MRGPRVSSTSDWLQTLQPLSIVLIVMIVGGSYYLWRRRILRSRAAFITLGAILLVLVYLGFIYKPGYLRYAQ